MNPIRKILIESGIYLGQGITEKILEKAIAKLTKWHKAEIEKLIPKLPDRKTGLFGLTGYLVDQQDRKEKHFKELEQ